MFVPLEKLHIAQNLRRGGSSGGMPTHVNFVLLLLQGSPDGFRPDLRLRPQAQARRDERQVLQQLPEPDLPRGSPHPPA